MVKKLWSQQTTEERVASIIGNQEGNVKREEEREVPETKFITDNSREFLARLKEISAPFDEGVAAVLKHYQERVNEIDPDDQVLTHHNFNNNPVLYFTVDALRHYVRVLESIITREKPW